LEGDLEKSESPFFIKTGGISAAGKDVTCLTTWLVVEQALQNTTYFAVFLWNLFVNLQFSNNFLFSFIDKGNVP
jgi:hypothetical protein